MKEILKKLKALKSVVSITKNKVGLNTITEIIKDLELLIEQTKG